MADSTPPSGYSEEHHSKVFPQPELDSPVTRERFIGKVVIVTGGNSGIGRAVVERFCNDGAKYVAIFARDIARGEALQNKCNAKGGNVKFFRVDVTDKERCLEAVKEVAEENGGRINFLVNNHAFFGGVNEPFLETTTEIFETSMSTNVVSYATLAQACFPFMKKDPVNSAIVNICSIGSHRAQSSRSVYNTSKAGLLMLTKCMALDMASHGIRVNSVSPGFVWTEAQRGVFGTREKFDDEICSFAHMTKTHIPSAGVASAVAFLCSKDARYINGTDLATDSGYCAMGPDGMGVK